MKQSKNKIYTDTYFYTKLRVVAAELRGCLRKQARIQVDFEPVEVCPLLYMTRISCTWRVRLGCEGSTSWEAPLKPKLRAHKRIRKSAARTGWNLRRWQWLQRQCQVLLYRSSTFPPLRSRRTTKKRSKTSTASGWARPGLEQGCRGYWGRGRNLGDSRR